MNNEGMAQMLRILTNAELTLPAKRFLALLLMLGCSKEQRVEVSVKELGKMVGKSMLGMFNGLTMLRNGGYINVIGTGAAKKNSYTLTDKCIAMLEGKNETAAKVGE